MLLKSGKEIVTGGQPYIVAEMNSSHNGNVEVAKAMIDAAKTCGCDAVKFQSWSAESLYCRDYYKKNPIAKRMVKSFALLPEDLLDLARYCQKINIDFSSTPYSKEEADFLIDDCQAPFIKIASMDIDNLPYLRYIGQKNIPIVLSTGMATVEEIDKAVKTIETTGNHDICILHCVSLYPVEARLVNLRNMIMLKERFPRYAVGYSDHMIGSEAACAAVALGAALIEKHFTLNNKKIGWDNQMATEPAEMKDLVSRCRKVYLSLGEYDRQLTPDEFEQRTKMRRSLIAAKDMATGHIIQEGDLDAKRPGNGIAVGDYFKVIGQELNCAIEKDQMISDKYFVAGGKVSND